MLAKTDHIVIIGFGTTGKSCVKYLLSRGYNNLTVIDSNPDIKNTTIRLTTDMNACDSADVIVISPGVSSELPAIKAAIARDVKVVGDIELFIQEAKAPIIAITGSNGKTTVTTLLGKIMQNANIKVGIGGNIGTAALSLLDGDYDYYLLELSSFQLETASDLNAYVACILNLAVDHLDRHKDIASYHKAKQRIFNGAQNIVHNRADFLQLPVFAYSFGLDYCADENSFGVDKAAENILYAGEPVVKIADVGLIGDHNIMNVMAVMAMCNILNIPKDIVIATIKSFAGLEHRTERLGVFNGVLWINDSKATNVAAACAAITSINKIIRGKLVLILGGICKENDISSLVSAVIACRNVILFGATTDFFYEKLQNKVSCIKANDLAEAVKFAKQITKPGDAVTLSPACSSFDMFKNYIDRGNKFRNIVMDVCNT